LTLVVDTSAVLAILGDEPEARVFSDLLVLATPSIFMFAGNVIEAYRVASGRSGAKGADQIDRLIERLALQIAPVDAAQTRLARDGMERFGKGRGTAPAVLNFGDLFAYALARAMRAPLLYKGDDFRATDVVPAWTP
jgi:ribonuclease VapC